MKTFLRGKEETDFQGAEEEVGVEENVVREDGVECLARLVQQVK